MEHMNISQEYHEYRKAQKNLQEAMQTYYDACILGDGHEESAYESIITAQSKLFIAWKRWKKEDNA